MFNKFLVILSLLFSIQSLAGICDDLQAELDEVVSNVPSPGAQLFVDLPDGNYCSMASGKFRISTGETMSPLSSLKTWSLSKTFTHVAILKLIESGHLKLDQKLSEIEQNYPILYQGYLKNYPQSEKIMLRHLLSHTSGIIDYMTLPTFLNNWEQSLSPGKIISIAAKNQDSIFPGEINRYSNTTMMILGRIVEVVTESSLEIFIEKELFQQAGLNSTYFATEISGWGRVYGYGVDEGGDFVDRTQKVSPSMVWGTGAVVSNAKDLSRWFKALLELKVLSQSMTQRMFTPVLLNDGSEAEYGLGFHIQKYSNGFVLIGHGGGPLEGNSATMLYSPQLKTVIVAMANGANSNSNVVLGAIGWKRVSEYLQGN